MNTKNVLMLVMLSAGMLTALTATATLQGQTAFADKKSVKANLIITATTRVKT
jgi:hypothetical protein